jgi:hypothetical protein
MLRTAKDSHLPASLREAVPRVHAVGSARDLHAFLMEDLSSYEMLFSYLLDPSRAESVQDIMIQLWETLEGMYVSSMSRLLIPNTELQYVDRLAAELKTIAAAEPRLGPDRHIRLTNGSLVIELPPWTEIIAAVRKVARDSKPPFSTLIHGDTNLGNVLVAGSQAGHVLRFIDLKDPGIGDWVRDLLVAPSLRTAAVVRDNGLTSPVELTDDSRGTSLSYRLPPPDEPLASAESGFLRRAATFAAVHGDHAWATRYKLNVATYVISLAGPHVADTDPRGRAVALAALGEGLRWLWAATPEGSNVALDGGPPREA